MILQIATALAIGAYVVLSKDSRLKRPNAVRPPSGAWIGCASSKSFSCGGGEDSVI
jgi:hypothetical protein